MQALPGVVFDLCRGVGDDHARGVDQHVDAAVARDRRPHHRLHLRLVGDVARHRENRGVGLRLRRRHAARQHLRAFAHEAPHHRRADAAGRAGDDRHAVQQAPHAASSAKNGLSGSVEPPSTTMVCPVM
ncbi:MAG: hypothetical protein LKCHEGNO_02178 [Burkholderiaceae bacterium]|nr:hypothetical protein [Burkholderiaceae bacterium]